MRHGFGGFLRIGVRFLVSRIGAQDAFLAVGLQANTPGKAITQQEGQNIVAEFAFFGWRIDFDAVVEIEKPFGAGAEIIRRF